MYDRFKGRFEKEYMFDRFEFWKTKGMNPSIIYDIGAHEGAWTTCAKKVFPTATYFAFEANTDMRENLQDLSSHFVVLGKENKEAIPFYKNTIGCTTGNSIYLEQTHFYTPQTAVLELRSVRTLESYVQENGIPFPDFIKLDVQGAELDILQGAGDILKAAKYIVLEASLHQYNAGAPLIEDLIAFLKQNSFEIIDFVEFHRINGYLAQVDVLFAHTSTGLRKPHFYDGHLEFS